MTYDWGGTVAAEPMSSEWFDEIDRRWLEASFPYTSENRPFDRIMPDSLAGARVLEIGCGMGLHTEQLISRGAEVTAIDLTEKAVLATKTRLALKGMEAVVRQADGERLPFESGSFDFVWSWGVIHHSSRTARVVREIARVLAEDGETRVMVYNRDSLLTKLTLIRYYLLTGAFRHRTADEVLWEHTDGFMARYFHAEQLEDLFRGFFEDVGSTVLGQEVDVVPLPGRIRRKIVSKMSDSQRREAADKRGGFLFATAKNPLR